MESFVLATFRDTAREKRTRKELLEKLLNDKELAESLVKRKDVTKEDIEEALDKIMTKLTNQRTYVNDTYQVAIDDNPSITSTHWPDMYCLSIRRLDREVIRDWRDLQEIKNLLIGKEHEGFELFPAESRLVDSANQYYIFVFKDPKMRLPFGFMERYVTNESMSTTKQRLRD